MDIMASEKEKKAIRLAVWLLRKKLGDGAKADAVRQDMMHCPNYVFQKVTGILLDAASKTDSGWQQKILGDIGLFGLWLNYKDTAYKPIFLWMLRELKHLMEEDEKLAQEIEDAEEPEDWYVNAWIRSKKHTKELRKKKKIPEYLKSEDESIFTPGEQQKRWSKM